MHSRSGARACHCRRIPPAGPQWMSSFPPTTKTLTCSKKPCSQRRRYVFRTPSCAYICWTTAAPMRSADRPIQAARKRHVRGARTCSRSARSSASSPYLALATSTRRPGTSTLVSNTVPVLCCGCSVSSGTEDADTSLILHGRGYRSAYIHRPLMSGLQPETFASFIGQRMRWAQGMAQILLLRNPLRSRGLHWMQRLAYLNSALFWFFGYARVVFLLAPAAYLLFGLKIYDANLLEVIAFALPHVIGGCIVTDHLFGRVRWAFVSELYEYMQSIFSIRAINKVLWRPHSPKFLVTPKGETLAAEQVSALAWPYYLLYAVTTISLIAGVWRYFNFPDQRDNVILTISWECFNFAIMLGAIGALLERRQRRATPRVPVSLPAVLRADDTVLACDVLDLSIGGARLRLRDHTQIPSSSSLWLELENPALRRTSRFH